MEDYEGHENDVSDGEELPSEDYIAELVDDFPEETQLLNQYGEGFEITRSLWQNNSQQQLPINAVLCQMVEAAIESQAGAVEVTFYGLIIIICVL